MKAQTKQLQNYGSRLVFDPYKKPIVSTRTGSLYQIHPYPTKINYESIIPYILAHTEPGEVVYDGFAGTCNTAFAAAACSERSPHLLDLSDYSKSRVKWGARKSICVDISQLSTFIGRTILKQVDAERFLEETERVLSELEKKWGWIYETTDDRGKRGIIRHIYWSEFLKCSHCGKEQPFLDVFVEMKGGGFKNVGTCSNCKRRLSFSSIIRVKEHTKDHLLGRNTKRIKRRPVVIFGQTGNRRWTRRATDADWKQVKKIEKISLPKWVSPIPMVTGEKRWGGMFRAGYHEDVSHVHHFYTPRNFAAIAMLFDIARSLEYRLQDHFKLLVSSYNTANSTLMTRFVFKQNSDGPVNTSAQPGALYIGRCPVEKNVFLGIRKKLHVMKSVIEQTGCWDVQSKIYTRPSQSSNLKDNSVDYIFTDPPFGDNIQYSELNFISESWLGKFTDNKYETIISKAQTKDVKNYGDLLTDAFKENFRILKPGKYMTVVFHNTKNEVWNSLQRAILSVGFQIINSSILAKEQTSFKQTTTPGAVKKDPVIIARKPLRKEPNITKKRSVTPREFILRRLEKVNGGPREERTFDYLFSRYLGRSFLSGYEIPIDSYKFRKILESVAYQRNGLWYLRRNYYGN